MRLHSRLLAIAATALAVCALAGASASAQQGQAELQSWHVPGWSFTPGVAIGTVYDNNVAVAGPDQFGKTASDTMMQFEPFGQLEFFSARTTFSSGYRGAMRRYFELSDLDGFDHRLYATLRHRVTRRVSIFLDQSFQQAPTTDELQLNGLPFLRVGSRYNLISGGVDARVTKSLDLTTRYEFSHVDFLDEATALRDGFVHGVHTSLTHRFGARASFGGEYGIRRANLNEGSRDYLFQNGGAVLQYRTGERTTVDLSGGLTYLVDRTFDVTRSGPYVKAALVHRAERATVGGEYQRNYTPSFGVISAQRSQELLGYVEMPFRQNRFYVQESAAWRRSDPFLTDNFPLNTLWVSSTLGYAIQRWLRLEAHHTFSSQDNRLAGGRVTRHLAGIQLVVSQPTRIR